jgi:hypothetical protein
MADPQSNAPSSFSFSLTLDSEAISGVAYREDGQALVLTFRSGGAHLYGRVPRGVAVGFATAESAGGYYHTHIKGKFPSTKVGT